MHTRFKRRKKRELKNNLSNWEEWKSSRCPLSCLFVVSCTFIHVSFSVFSVSYTRTTLVMLIFLLWREFIASFQSYNTFRDINLIKLNFNVTRRFVERWRFWMKVIFFLPLPNAAVSIERWYGVESRRKKGNIE